MNTVCITSSTKMSTPEKVRGQNTGHPLHFKKSGDISPCLPTDLRPLSLHARREYFRIKFLHPK